MLRFNNKSLLNNNKKFNQINSNSKLNYDTIKSIVEDNSSTSLRITQPHKSNIPRPKLK